MFLSTFLIQLFIHLCFIESCSSNYFKLQGIKHFEYIDFVYLNDKNFNRTNFLNFKFDYNQSKHHFKLNTAYIQLFNQQLFINLISFNKFFSMILFPSIKIPVTTINFNLTKHSTVTCYTGYLQNSPFNSKLFAYFHNQLLNAIIFEYDNIFHLDQLNDSQVIMYKESDLNLSDYKYFDHSIGDEFVDFEFNSNSFPLYSKRNLFYNNVPLYPNPSICDIELISDHTFTSYFNHDTVRISSELFLMLMKANSIYIQTDFNLDGKPEGISLQLARIIVFHTENENGYTWSQTNLEPTEILNRFGLRLQNHCLAISFLHRDFAEFSKYPGTLGVGWVGKVDNHFGICSKPVLNLQVSRNQLFIGNTGIVTNINRRKIRNRAEVSLTLTHEITHLFGANHDDNEEVQNKYGYCGKMYLMSLIDSSTSNTPTKEQLSHCSRRQIDIVLRAKSTCFRPYKPFCGNGIKEIGEECDCGPEFVCSIIDPCCESFSCRLKSQCKYSISRPNPNRPTYNYPNRPLNYNLLPANYEKPPLIIQNRPIYYPNRPPNLNQPPIYYLNKPPNFNQPPIYNYPNRRPNFNQPPIYNYPNRRPNLNQTIKTPPPIYYKPNNRPIYNQPIRPYIPVTTFTTIVNRFDLDEDYEDENNYRDVLRDINLNEDYNEKKDENFKLTSTLLPSSVSSPVYNGIYISFKGLYIIVFIVLPISFILFFLIVQKFCFRPNYTYKKRRRRRLSSY